MVVVLLVLVLGGVFELATSDGASDGTKNTMASELVTGVVTANTTGDGAHDATLAFLGSIWVIWVDRLRLLTVLVNLALALAISALMLSVLSIQVLARVVTTQSMVWTYSWPWP